MDFDLRTSVGPQGVANGGRPLIRGDILGGQHVSDLLPKHFELVRNGMVFGALAQTVTAPVIWTTAAGSGGPFIYNGTNDKNLVPLAFGLSDIIVSTVAGSVGLATGVTTAPTAVTAADARWNLLTGGAASSATPYRIATPSAAATSFLPLIEIGTGALTVSNQGLIFFPIEGMCVIAPGGFMTLAGSATLTTLQYHAAIIWAELPR